jgi:hypothetical protein
MPMNPYESDLPKKHTFMLKISLFRQLLAIKIEIAPKVYYLFLEIKRKLYSTGQV